MGYFEKYMKHFVDMGKSMVLKSRIYRIKDDLHAEYFFTEEPVRFEDRLNYKLRPIEKNEVWGRRPFGCAWFRFTGKIPADYKKRHYVLLIDIGGEGCLYSKNGYPIRGITDKRAYVSGLFAVKGKQEILLDEIEFDDDGNIDIWLDAGCLNDAGVDHFDQTKYARFAHAWIAEKRDDICDLFYDFSTLAMAKSVRKKEDKQGLKISCALGKAFSLGVIGTKKNVKKAREILSKAFLEGVPLDYHAYAMGHSHLDLGFMWPIRETHRKNIRTFANQLCNVKKFPDYVFGLSQPQLLEWLEEDNPKMFSEVKNAFDKGNFTPTGGMWVEADMNLPNGESIIRQCYYGRKYWKEKLNQETRVCWLPDTFGYNGNLPQIIKKCGMDYFMTTKMSWNDTNYFPYRSFIWEGIDGTEVLTHMPPEETYSGESLPTSNMFALDKYPERNVSKSFMLVYGIGDGGGGPNEGHIEFISRQRHCPTASQVEFSGTDNYFKALEKEKESLPHYKGELYLETHRGTYTTRSDNKLANRKIEFKLHDLEYVLTQASLKGYEYPHKELEKIWKEVLLYQFHDILPGSSVNRVYQETDVAYKRLFEKISTLQSDALNFLANGKKSLVAFNPTAFAQRKIFATKEGYFYAEIPPFSTKNLKPFKAVKGYSASADFLISPLFKITFKNGEIISLIDKKTGKELNKDFLNRLNVYTDKPTRFEAWDFDMDYLYHVEHFKFVKSVPKIWDTGACLENHYRYNDSTIIQKVILTADTDYINFETFVDWQELHKMLRADFIPSVYSKEVTCDIQMASLKRKTTQNDKIERAQFEIPAQKYVDLTDGDYGISFLTDSKYGWRVKDGLVSLNLLRSTDMPARKADVGKHTFSYAIYPHASSYEDSDTIKTAYIYNNPAYLIENDVNFSGIVEKTNDNVILETIKQSEKQNGIVIRLYESKGSQQTTSIKPIFTYSKIYESDCVEENLIEIESLSDLTFKPFEIRTFILTK